MQRQLKQIVVGSTMLNMNSAAFGKLIAAVPPIEEQHAIVDILAAVDHAIIETDVLIAKHELIRLGLLDDLIAIPAQVGQSGAPDTFAGVVASISSGCSVNADDRPPSAGEFGVLKTSAVGGGRFRPNESKAVWPREVNRLKCPVAAGLILFSRMNTPQLVGENAFVAQDHPGLFLPDRLWAIRLKEGEDILPEWVATILQTRQARAFITGEATGTSGSMKNIARTSLLRLPMRKLPERDQADAMKAVGALQSEIDLLTSERDKLAALRLGLRYDLLTGRVPVVAMQKAAE
jgi:restriction endonuclease S subunit